MTKRKQDLPSPGYSVGYGKPRKQHASNLVKAEISKVGHGGDERTLSLRFTGCSQRDSSLSSAAGGVAFQRRKLSTANRGPKP